MIISLLSSIMLDVYVLLFSSHFMHVTSSYMIMISCIASRVLSCMYLYCVYIHLSSSWLFSLGNTSIYRVANICLSTSTSYLPLESTDLWPSLPHWSKTSTYAGIEIPFCFWSKKRLYSSFGYTHRPLLLPYCEEANRPVEYYIHIYIYTYIY